MRQGSCEIVKQTNPMWLVSGNPKYRRSVRLVHVEHSEKYIVYDNMQEMDRSHQINMQSTYRSN